MGMGDPELPSYTRQTARSGRKRRRAPLFPGPARVFIPRFLWRVVSPDATGSSPALVALHPGGIHWDTPFFSELFQGRNGWSIRDYWLRATFGLLDLQFQLAGSWWILERDQ